MDVMGGGSSDKLHGPIAAARVLQPKRVVLAPDPTVVARRTPLAPGAGAPSSSRAWELLSSGLDAGGTPVLENLCERQVPELEPGERRLATERGERSHGLCVDLG